MGPDSEPTSFTMSMILYGQYLHATNPTFVFHAQIRAASYACFTYVGMVTHLHGMGAPHVRICDVLRVCWHLCICTGWYILSRWVYFTYNLACCLIYNLALALWLLSSIHFSMSVTYGRGIWDWTGPCPPYEYSLDPAANISWET